MLVEATRALRVGTGDGDFFGPVINEEQMTNMLAAVSRAKAAGATVLTGGDRVTGPGYDGGYFVAPTLIENVGAGRRGVQERALRSHHLPLPRAHVRRGHRARQRLALRPDRIGAHPEPAPRHDLPNRIQSGVAVVNGGTYGSEPHMPFGGLRQSGNGWREAGTEALDVYSDAKTIYINHNPDRT